MRLPHRVVTSFEDATRNGEALEAQALYAGNGAPTFKAETGAYYFRHDTPATANQRIYVFNGTTWTGIV